MGRATGSSCVISWNWERPTAPTGGAVGRHHGPCLVASPKERPPGLPQLRGHPGLPLQARLSRLDASVPDLETDSCLEGPVPMLEVPNHIAGVGDVGETEMVSPVRPEGDGA